MKTLLFLAALSFCSATFLNVQSIQAQASGTTTVTPTSPPNTTVTPPPNTTVTPTPPPNKESVTQICCNCDGKLPLLEWLLTLAPLLIFLLFWMKSDLGKIKGYLVETTDAETPTREVKEVTAATKGVADAGIEPVPATTTITTEPSPKPSTSRLLVFVSGFTTLIITVCLVCFWIYVYLTECRELSFDNLTTLIWALVVGVAPYGFNRLSASMKTTTS